MSPCTTPLRLASGDVVPVLVNRPRHPQGLEPRALATIHGTLFADALPDRRWVGSFRTVDIEKEEPVLGGRSVNYAHHCEILPALRYDFETERSNAYPQPFDAAAVGRFSRFVAGIWQIHPFREGNTRAIAVFSQLYLRSMGIAADSDIFLQNSIYYRDALVRASYSCIQDDIVEDPTFIERFYGNVILGRGDDLAIASTNLHGIRVVDCRALPYRS